LRTFIAIDVTDEVRKVAEEVTEKLMRRGFTLSRVTEEVCRRLGIRARIIPMTDDKVDTFVVTDRGEMHIQEFLVLHRGEPEVRAIHFPGLGSARPAPGVIEAIRGANLIIIGPSNPVNSIGPILGVNGVAKAMMETDAVKIAVSPLIRGKPGRQSPHRPRGAGFLVHKQQENQAWDEGKDKLRR